VVEENMKLKSERFSLRILLAIVLCATASFSAAAEKVNLDPIAERLAVHVRKAGTKLVAVADFLDADGQPSDLGWYLASKLSDKLQGRSEGFRLLNRGQLLDSKVTTEDIASAESLTLGASRPSSLAPSRFPRSTISSRRRCTERRMG
jgi:hypothetical protein